MGVVTIRAPGFYQGVVNIAAGHALHHVLMTDYTEIGPDIRKPGFVIRGMRVMTESAIAVFHGLMCKFSVKETRQVMAQ